MSIEDIGCCGAYCGTCPVIRAGACRGCKTGYRSGERDISRARCRIKICCIRKGYQSCADCTDYESCGTIQEFHHRNGYKYKKYREAIVFIIGNGYDRFLKITDGWKNQVGPY
ncbi:DUF3795 domain-containing protein [bacterium]|nr:DUF3795 domain-containing protein [bacterium]